MGTGNDKERREILGAEIVGFNNDEVIVKLLDCSEGDENDSTYTLTRSDVESKGHIIKVGINIPLSLRVDD